MEKPKFQGFEIPQQNWFKLPNSWTDLTAEMRSWAEHKIVEYVLRHTWGYQEYGQLKLITLDEFENGRRRKDGSRMDNGVGLRRQAILSGIKQAVEDGFLIIETDDRDKGRVKKYYGLKMQMNGTSQGYDLHTPDSEQGYEDHTPEVRNSYSKGMESTPRTEKETLERNHREKKGSHSQNTLWPEVLAACKQQMTQATYDTHLAHSRLLSLENGKAVIGLPNEMSKEWVEQRLLSVIERSLANHLDGPSPALEFVALS